jgi:hypothetical protein
MNKKIIIPVAALVLLGTTVFGSTMLKVSAQDTANRRTSVIQKIASKFNLNEADIQSVFDQERTERQIEMKSFFEKNLSEKVANGSLTEAQKQLIIAKHDEIQVKHQTNEPGERQNMTSEERTAERELRQAEKTELETWATANGISIDDLMIGGKGEGRMNEREKGQAGGRMGR